MFEYTPDARDICDFSHRWEIILKNYIYKRVEYIKEWKE